VLEVVTNSALRVTSGHLEDLAAIVETGNVEHVRKALFDLVAQVRGEKPGAPPSLRVVAGG
jgi:O-antigen biosynthesis protein WbqV